MAILKLSDMEIKFADIIWENEPIKSSELVKLCEIAFSWKKSTTYTMLKRIIEKGIFKNEGGLVFSIISKTKFYSEQSKQYVSEAFGGSLPKFLVAFANGKRLSKKEIDELQLMIDKNKGV